MGKAWPYEKKNCFFQIWYNIIHHTLPYGQISPGREKWSKIGIFSFFLELRCDQTVRLEPELELFEVLEIMVRQIIITIIPNFKQLKLNFQMSQREKNKNRKIIYTEFPRLWAHQFCVWFYTFSYREAVIRPQNMPKNADCQIKKKIISFEIFLECNS